MKLFTISIKGSVLSMPSKSTRYKKTLCTAALLFSVGISTGGVLTSEHQSLKPVLAASIKGASGQWGNITWTLANDGELILAGGDIGSTQLSLSATLKQSGVDPSTVKSIEITKKTVIKGMPRAFADLPNLQSIVGMGKIDYSGTAYCMFLDNKALTTIDLSGFDTSKINNMGYMFARTGITDLDVSNFNTSNVTTMYGMFDGSSTIKQLNLSNFDTSKVTTMEFMFYGVTVPNIDVSSFNTSNVTSMAGMFDATTKLDTLDLSNFDTSKVSTMQYMFLGSAVKDLNVSSFDTSKTTNLKSMFSNLKNLDKLDISSFSISNATQTDAMFANSKSVNLLKVGKKSRLKPEMKLPEISATSVFTGKWQNIGSGSVTVPEGDHVWSSTEFLNNFNPTTMGDDTFVWQKKQTSESIIHAGKIADYTNDLLLSTYIPSAVTPLNPYRYNVVLNNEYNFFSKIDDGQAESKNVVDLGDIVGATVYNRQTMPVTYEAGDKDGQTTNFVEISLDGKDWYWVDQHALNIDLEYKYPALNSSGKKLEDGMYYGSTSIYGVLPIPNTPVNSQMISNAYNKQGKIIYQSKATLDDFNNFNNPEAALQSFNDNLDHAADSWNDALSLSEPVLVKASADNKVSLVVSPNPAGSGSATSNGNTGIDSSLANFALNPSDPNYKTNMLFITMRHELGHSLGLNHTANGQYYGMPDNYTFSIDDDVMNAVLVHTPDGYPWTQKTITPNNIKAIKLILKNKNFLNPQH